MNRWRSDEASPVVEVRHPSDARRGCALSAAGSGPGPGRSYWRPLGANAVPLIVESMSGNTNRSTLRSP